MAFFRTYLLPGFVFQSVVIGGGYATGRELIEFFFASGPLGGVLGLLMSGLVFGLVLAAGFEFARVKAAYDYRSFCRALLGRAWVIYEIAFVALLLLILSIIASAAGELAASTFGIPSSIGTLVLLALTALLTFYGADLIKRVLAGWSFLLYGVYITLFGLVLAQFGDEIGTAFTSSAGSDSWVQSGILYAGYNLAILPTVLFAVKGQSSRCEALSSGMLAGVIAVAPAILFFVALMALYPEISTAAIPSAALMSALQMPVLGLVFQVVIFGTFVETGTALLHAVNERVNATLTEAGHDMPRVTRPLIAISAIVIATVAGTQFGITALIAQGYNFLTIVFICVLVLPLLLKCARLLMQKGTEGPSPSAIK
ncbi:MAG: hypothetical protein JJ850_12450 [Kordiimonadaceae bacterium]|nr:hypothetical protein [Kordiimonadaceae bacterium]MBO6568598.1 hypothetical protein [Kordiimonadaceae bacterium]MBO6965426.1 hypothetical protein [Kordiimonadaceae bacterium]